MNYSESKNDESYEKTIQSFIKNLKQIYLEIFSLFKERKSLESYSIKSYLKINVIELWRESLKIYAVLIVPFLGALGAAYLGALILEQTRLRESLWPLAVLSVLAGAGVLWSRQVKFLENLFIAPEYNQPYIVWSYEKLNYLKAFYKILEIIVISLINIVAFIGLLWFMFYSILIHINVH